MLVMGWMVAAAWCWVQLQPKNSGSPPTEGASPVTSASCPSARMFKRGLSPFCYFSTVPKNREFLMVSSMRVPL